MLDLPLSQVADYLDTCLQSSYWQRRLQRSDGELKRLQEAVVRGRAACIWSHTDAAKRNGYFAAGVGYAAGNALDSNAVSLRALLEIAEDALANGNVEEAVRAALALARILFSIHPFQPQEIVPEWPRLLGEWLRGRALGEFANNQGVSFIQGDVVFRLVWGVEAARLHIAQISSSGDEDQGVANLAMCLTYGVPNRTAALFMQAGMNSRTLACMVAQVTEGSVRDVRDLKAWVYSVLQDDSQVPAWDSEDARAEWQRFLQRFEHREHSNWRRLEFDLPVRWHGQPRKAGTRVRVSFEKGDVKAAVLGVSLELLGETIVPKVSTTHFFGIVGSDQTSLRVSFFGA